MRYRIGGAVLTAFPPLLCASGAMALQAAPPAAAGATLEISKGYELGAGLGHAAVQTYYLNEGADCRRWTRTGALSWITSEAKTRPIEPGKFMVVFSETARRSNAGGGYMLTSTCWGAATFTPLAGHAYRARLVAPRAGRCYMQVEDGQTNAPVGTPLKIGTSLCPAPEQSEAARYLDEYARQRLDSGNHSRDLYAPATTADRTPVQTRALPLPAAPPPPPAARIWATSPPAPVQAWRPVQTWAAVAPAPAPGPAGAAGRVVDVRVNGDGTVSESREH